MSLKSADRREIFEEAAGISKYRHRKEETERKLAHTDDNLLRIGDKVSELELQLEPLKIQSEKARKYLDYKEELQGIEVAVWLDRLDKLSADAKKAEEDYASAAFVLEQAKEDLDKLYERSETLGNDLRSRDADLENIRIKVSMLDGVHQQLEGQIAILRSNIENNDGNIARIENELQGADDRSGGIAAQMEQTKARVAQIGQELTAKRETILQLQQQLAAMASSAQGMTRQYLQLRSRESELTADIAGREADIRGLEAALAENNERATQLDSELNSGTDRKDAAQEQLLTCRGELKSAREEVTSCQNMINGYTLRQTTRAKRRDELDGQLRELNAKLDGISAKLRIYKAMERDFENYHKSVRMVMQESQKGVLRNIHGPVSKLIRTHDDYAIAIEIALGGAMQDIVVETEQDAKAAINYLKRTGGGRATFLPLNMIKGRTLKENGLDRCAGFVGIASELVTCDSKYQNVIEDLLGRIVIAETIDFAIAMAKKFGSRFKIVTLDGQVMNAGGSMTGGSTNKESGILSRANELEKLQEQETKLLDKQKSLEQELQEAQRSVDQVEFQLKAAADQLRSAQDQVLTLEGREKQYEIMLGAITDAFNGATRELESLRNREKLDRERFTSQQTKIQMFQQELTKLRNELQLLEGSQVEAEETTGKINDQISQLKAEEAALDAEAATAQLHIEDLQQLCTAMQGDRAQKIALIQEIKNETLRLQQQIGELQVKQQENAADADAVREERDNALAQRAETEAAKTRAEREAQEKNKDILNMERACALLENKKETTGIEERNTIDKLWDTYGLTPSTAVEKRGQIESVAAGNRRIVELKRKIGALGTPNLGAIEEYARVNERYTYLTGQRDDVLTSKKELEAIIREITQEMTTIFVAEFAKINTYFGQVFEEMFGGGKGQLILEDPESPLTCGIEIRVQPPGKQVKTITLLSGGEKAFVAIALYFAILKVRPTPFCMLDEIDAALDDRNVERFASYLHNLSVNTQFIVITHRRGTMELADVLYGVTMQEQGISKLLRLDLNQMEEQLGIAE